MRTHKRGIDGRKNPGYKTLRRLAAKQVAAQRERNAPRKQTGEKASIDIGSLIIFIIFILIGIYIGSLFLENLSHKNNTHYLKQEKH